MEQYSFISLRDAHTNYFYDDYGLNFDELDLNATSFYLDGSDGFGFYMLQEMIEFGIEEGLT